MLQFVSPSTIKKGGRDIRVGVLWDHAGTCLCANLLILNKEVDEVFVVHDLLVFHWHHDLHLVIERRKSLHKYSAVSDEPVDNIVVVSLDFVFIGAFLINRDDLTESGKHLISGEMRQLIEAVLEVSSGSQERCELLRFVEVGQPSNILHKLVQEEHALLHERIIRVPHRLLLGNWRDIQSKEPTMQNVSQEVELFVATINFKVSHMIHSFNLVQVVLANRVILNFAFAHVNNRWVVLFTLEYILEGRYNTRNLNWLLLFDLLHCALEKHILLLRRSLSLIHIHWRLILVNIVSLWTSKHSPIRVLKESASY